MIIRSGGVSRALADRVASSDARPRTFPVFGHRRARAHVVFCKVVALKMRLLAAEGRASRMLAMRESAQRDARRAGGGLEMQLRAESSPIAWELIIDEDQWPAAATIR
jgi:hypothetical protein